MKYHPEIWFGRPKQESSKRHHFYIDEVIAKKSKKIGVIAVLKTFYMPFADTFR